MLNDAHPPSVRIDGETVPKANTVARVESMVGRLMLNAENSVDTTPQRHGLDLPHRNGKPLRGLCKQVALQQHTAFSSQYISFGGRLDAFRHDANRKVRLA